MKRYGHLWPQITNFANLAAAARQAQRGKRTRPNVLAFNYNLAAELLKLHEELHTKTYQPGAYRTFEIVEPKRRLISAAPDSDRVVHHALCHIIAPIFERTKPFRRASRRWQKRPTNAHARRARFGKRCKRRSKKFACSLAKSCATCSRHAPALPGWKRANASQQRNQPRPRAEARYDKERVKRLTILNGTLDVLRHRTRLLLDFQLLSAERYRHAAKLIDEIGKELGGWLKQQRQRA